MSVLPENVEKLFGRPLDDKNTLNDNGDAVFAGFELVLPLIDIDNCCARVVEMSMLKK